MHIYSVTNMKRSMQYGWNRLWDALVIRTCSINFIPWKITQYRMNGSSFIELHDAFKFSLQIVDNGEPAFCVHTTDKFYVPSHGQRASFVDILHSAPSSVPMVSFVISFPVSTLLSCVFFLLSLLPSLSVCLAISHTKFPISMFSL